MVLICGTVSTYVLHPEVALIAVPWLGFGALYGSILYGREGAHTTHLPPALRCSVPLLSTSP
ncbi:hypothetical protein TSHO111613_07740 [Tsukamurella hominis]